MDLDSWPLKRERSQMSEKVKKAIAYIEEFKKVPQSWIEFQTKYPNWRKMKSFEGRSDIPDIKNYKKTIEKYNFIIEVLYGWED